MTILEFSEEWQGFHYNKGTRPENTHGWQTLVKCKNDIEADAYADFLQFQFMGKGRQLSFKTAQRAIKNLQLFYAAYRNFADNNLVKGN